MIWHLFLFHDVLFAAAHWKIIALLRPTTRKFVLKFWIDQSKTVFLEIDSMFDGVLPSREELIKALEG